MSLLELNLITAKGFVHSFKREARPRTKERELLEKVLLVRV